MADTAELTGFRAFVKRAPEFGVALLILVVLGSLVLPIPTLLLDVLLALSISLSVIVLLTTIYTSNPLEFNAFPGILLILTLLRLGLNVATTKLILGEGDAGHIVEAFGNFVVRGNIVVGMLVFLILVIVNFMVITKGAGRVAEVAARFTLDAMPGKMMAIDGDMQNGLITPEEAIKKRSDIERAADFYGSMDGAAKFVRGDAVAGLIITVINLLGGLYVGIVQRGMDMGASVELYSKLTIGDGLVSQIPALIVSTAAGIIVTQAAGSAHMGDAMFSQLTKHSRSLWVSAGVIGLFAVMPGLPFIPFALLAGGIAGLALAAQRRDDELELALATPAVQASAKPGERGPNDAPEAAKVNQILQVDALEVQLGYTLADLADPAVGGDLLDKITSMRTEAAVEMGLLVPAVRIRDNMNLSPNTYAILIRGVRVAEWEIFPKCLLAVDAGDTLHPIEGFREVRDPAYGLPALWIQPDQKVEAEAAGYMVFQPSTVLATHLQETVRQNAAELLGRQEVQELVDGLKKSHPALVKDVVPEKVSLGTLHRVLQGLLKEGVPVRDLVTVLETLSDAADQQVREPEVLVEWVRRALSKVIAHMHQREDGAVHGIMMSPRMEAALMRTFSPSPDARQGEILNPEQLRNALDDLQAQAIRHRYEGRLPPLIAPPSLRVAARRLVDPVIPNLSVISIVELPSNIPIHALASWDVGGARPQSDATR